VDPSIARCSAVSAQSLPPHRVPHRLSPHLTKMTSIPRFQSVLLQSPLPLSPSTATSGSRGVRGNPSLFYFPRKSPTQTYESFFSRQFPPTAIVVPQFIASRLPVSSIPSQGVPMSKGHRSISLERLVSLYSRPLSPLILNFPPKKAADTLLQVEKRSRAGAFPRRPSFIPCTPVPSPPDARLVPNFIQAVETRGRSDTRLPFFSDPLIKEGDQNPFRSQTFLSCWRLPQPRSRLPKRQGHFRFFLSPCAG